MAETLTTVGGALASGRINLDEPRWDQSSYMGRAKHFFTTTNPLNIFASSADLDWAKDVVTKYRKVSKSSCLLVIRRPRLKALRQCPIAKSPHFAKVLCRENLSDET